MSIESPPYAQIGTRPVRPDGIEKVTGRARFSADLTLPRQLHGIVVRSTMPHARIVSIDTKKAQAMPGVKAVVTGADFPTLDIDDPAHDDATNIIARDEVFYHGHAIAAIAAVTSKQAKAAADVISVTYEELPAVFDIDSALAENAPIVNPTNRTIDTDDAGPSNIASRDEFRRGDVHAGFDDADIVLERTFTTRSVHQGYIEPHSCVVDCGQDGKASIWASSQGHFMVRAKTAAVLGWSIDRIKVTPAEIGGGFGGKTTVYLEPLAVRLSQMTGRPVKMTMTRAEVLNATGPAPATKIHAKLGATSDGTITTLEARLLFNTGAFKAPHARVGATSINCYRLANLSLDAIGVVTNTPRCAAYRAPSAPQAALAIETLVDELATMIGQDPIDVRLKNAVVKGDLTIVDVPHPTIGLVQTLEAIKKSDHYNSPVPEGVGRGIAAGFWFNIGDESSATVNLNADGSVVVLTGSPDIGGSRASMALMAAETLGIDYHSIASVVADTESVGFTDISHGSRVTFATGMAVTNACKAVIAELRKRAALMMGVDVESVDWVNGSAVAAGCESLTIRDIAVRAKETGGPITASTSLNALGAGPSFAVHVADVSVDEETGVTTVLRYTAAQDAGTAIHPDYVEGQLQGGAAQGIGWALNEAYEYTADGVLDNASFLDYRMPVASDLPMIDTVIVEVPNPAHPYGVRGVGETPIVPPLATMANAIAAATGLRLSDLPLSPPAVLAALTSGG